MGCDHELACIKQWCEMLVLKLLCFPYYYFIWNLGCNNFNHTLMYGHVFVNSMKHVPCMLNHVRSWLYVGDESRTFVVLDGLLGLYGLKYDSATACGLPLYLCSYKLDGFVTIGSQLFHSDQILCPRSNPRRSGQWEPDPGEWS